MDRLGFKQCGDEGESRYWYEVVVDSGPLWATLTEWLEHNSVGSPIPKLSWRQLLERNGSIAYSSVDRFNHESDDVVKDFLIKAESQLWFMTAFTPNLCKLNTPYQLLLGFCDGCGEWGCSSISARMVVSRDTVEWSAFKYREKYAINMPLLRFDRDQYESAIEFMSEAARSVG